MLVFFWMLLFLVCGVFLFVDLLYVFDLWLLWVVLPISGVGVFEGLLFCSLGGCGDDLEVGGLVNGTGECYVICRHDYSSSVKPAKLVCVGSWVKLRRDEDSCCMDSSALSSKPARR